jgi:hypothetical protein
VREIVFRECEVNFREINVSDDSICVRSVCVLISDRVYYI